MKHGVPKVIYLQICDDPDCDVPYDDHDGITWCSHRINKTDVKYVLAKDKPQRTWVGLTDEERSKIWGELPSTLNEERDACIFAECIEIYLKERNA